MYARIFARTAPHLPFSLSSEDNRRVIGFDLLSELRARESNRTIPWWGSFPRTAAKLETSNKSANQATIQHKKQQTTITTIIKHSETNPSTQTITKHNHRKPAALRGEPPPDTVRRTYFNTINTTAPDIEQTQHNVREGAKTAQATDIASATNSMKTAALVATATVASITQQYYIILHNIIYTEIYYDMINHDIINYNITYYVILFYYAILCYSVIILYSIILYYIISYYIVTKAEQPHQPVRLPLRRLEGRRVEGERTQAFDTHIIVYIYIYIYT